jgi:hypothetical protein
MVHGAPSPRTFDLAQVVAVLRKPEDGEEMKRMGALPVLCADISKPLPPLPCKVDAAVSCLGVRDWGATDSHIWDTMCGGTMQVCEAALGAGSSKMVVLSAVQPRDAKGNLLPYTTLASKARDSAIHRIMTDHAIPGVSSSSPSPYVTPLSVPPSTATSSTSSSSSSSSSASAPKLALTVVEAAMLFKDADRIYKGIKKSGKQVGWTGDLAFALHGAFLCAARPIVQPSSVLPASHPSSLLSSTLR